MYNRDFDDNMIYFCFYADNKVLVPDNPDTMSGFGVQLSNNREKFSFEISDYQFKLKTDKINKISFLIKAHQLDERWDGTQDIKIFPLIASSKKNVKLYYEFHVFGKNKLEIRK